MQDLSLAIWLHSSFLQNILQIVVSFLGIFKYIYSLAAQWGLWDLSSQTRDGTRVTTVKAPSPNHEAPGNSLPQTFLRGNFYMGRCTLQVDLRTWATWWWDPFKLFSVHINYTWMCACVCVCMCADWLHKLMDIYEFFSINNDWWSRASKLCKSLFLTHLTLIVCSVQFSLVTQLCLTLCDPMDRGTTGLSVHHQLPESTQTHVHWVGVAIQPSHPLLSPSLPAFILFMGFSRQEYWSGLPFPSPVDHILSELSTITHPSWVTLHGMA